MNLGERVTALRKQKNMPQTDPAKAETFSREIIGRYEPNVALPSIEVAKKIADAFDVSLDYLVREGSQASFDMKRLKRPLDIEKSDEEIKKYICFFTDNTIQNFKTKKTYVFYIKHSYA